MLKAEYVAAAISRKSTASCTFVVNLFCHVSRKVVSKDFVKNTVTFFVVCCLVDAFET